jgi:hypothetical protein
LTQAFQFCEELSEELRVEKDHPNFQLDSVAGGERKFSLKDLRAVFLYFVSVPIVAANGLLMGRLPEPL